MFMAALFIITKKRRSNPNVHQPMNKVWYTYTMEYYTTTKEMKF